MYIYSTYSHVHVQYIDNIHVHVQYIHVYIHIPVHVHMVMIYIQHFKNLLFLNSNTTVKSHFSNCLVENIIKYKNHVH